MSFEFETLIRHVTESVRLGTEKELAELTKKFNTPVQALVRSGWVTSNCSDIIFINLTPLTVLTNGEVQVNNYTLDPGGFLSIGGNNAEINDDTYNVVFGTSATKVVVIKKLYVKK